MKTTTLAQSIDEAQKGKFEVFEFAYQFSRALKELWIDDVDNNQNPELNLDAVAETPLFSRSRREPIATAWSISLTPSFCKTISNIDKNLRAKILLVIFELSQEPVTLQGDTKKPLAGDFKGLWRYRVGDYRLIYEPRKEDSKVILLEFSARGSVYDL
ncbi:MAG TPA: type II toxin-antitoxin system RelE/ParE family toxin [Methylotenera sp.]|nr:type II toxin-antitoxin system RelE/ParE family toxin [Methylotenera sp.]